MAGESLQKLAEALFADGKPSLSVDLVDKFRSDDAIREGFSTFFSILKSGVKVFGDGRWGFQSWNDSQIQAISSFAYAIASASRSLSGAVSIILSTSIEF